MRAIHLITAAASIALLTAPALAQDTTTNTTGSNANAQSGSASGAESNGNQQGQSQSGGNNAGIGSSRNDLQSTSTSGAISGSDSRSGAVSDQTQGQGQGQGQTQGANNDQTQGQSQDARNSQTQGQTANNGQTSTNDNRSSASNANTLGQTAANNQGVTVTQTYNYAPPLKRTYVGTNTAVPLAASSSFSSDYCGGTASGGASIAPIGVSIGGAAPVFDNSCRYLRLGEKAGMLAANYHNMGQETMAMKAMSLMSWATCMAGPQQDRKRKHDVDNHVMEACIALGLLGSAEAAPPAPPANYVAPAPQQAPVTPLETQKPNVTPPANESEHIDPPVLGANDKARPAMAVAAH